MQFQHEMQYVRHIDRKTAGLFKLAAVVGAILVRAEDHKIECAKTFGRDFGIAFQILDDLLDCGIGKKEIGKPRFSDMRNGVVTLPVIHYLTTAGNKAELVSLLREGLYEEAFSLLLENGSLKYAANYAEQKIDSGIRAVQEIFPKAEVSYIASLAQEHLLKIKEGVLHGI